MRKLRIMTIVIVILCVAGSGMAEQNYTAEKDDLGMVSYPADGWKHSTPEAQGMDSTKLAAAIEYLLESELKPDQLLVIRNSTIVADVLFAPYHGGQHDVASVSKSIMSAILGIAIDKGYIGSLDDTVSQYIGDSVGRNKAGITLRDMITMQSGFGISGNHMIDFYKMLLYGDWVKYIESIGVNKNETGVKFAYNNFTPYIISLILNSALNSDVARFADEYLFAPLGITDYMMPADPSGSTIRAYGDMAFTAYDQAKIGLLYLNHGMWDEKQIISQKWIAEATQNQVENFIDTMPYTSGYGYYWWIDEDGHFSARGMGNQRIDVFPDQNMIIVINSRSEMLYNEIYEAIHVLYQEYILASIVSDRALEANETASGMLREAVGKAAETGSDTHEVNMEKALDQQYLDTVYTLTGNIIGMSSLLVTKESDGMYMVKIKINPSEGIDEMILPLSIQGETRYYLGRKNIEGMCFMTEVREESISFFVDEIGNITKWDIKLSFLGDTLTIAVDDAMGTGLNMSIYGKKEGATVP